jgi:hypothetical protein
VAQKWGQKWPKNGSKMGYFDPFFDPFLSGPGQARTGPERACNCRQPELAISGPVLSRSGQDPQKGGQKGGPKWAILDPFFDPFLSGFGPDIPCWMEVLSQNGSKRGSKMGYFGVPASPGPVLSRSGQGWSI